MIKHIVFWKLKDEADGRSKAENAKIIKQLLEALPEVIDELISAEVGININGGEYDAALTCTFESMENLKSYDCHEAHMKVREFITKVRESRVAVDYEF